MIIITVIKGISEERLTCFKHLKFPLLTVLLIITHEPTSQLLDERYLVHVRPYE